MKKLYYISPLILQTLIWIPTRIIFKLIYSYQVKGLENLKELKYNKHGVIFAVNHSSELDPIMIPASLPFLSRLMPIFYVSREQKFYKNSGWKQVFYGGSFFRLWGAYNAYVGLKNYKLSLRNHIDILNDGKSVCIFPEGHKTRDGKIGEGKSGVAFLASETKSVVVPVKIKGLYNPERENDFLGRRKLTVSFGKPLYQKDIFNNPSDQTSIEDLKRGKEIIMSKMKYIV